MTNSDGIFVRGELVEAGDWTGFGGAARILSEPRLDLAILETARGGILLRGIGYAANDVGVVTNVSADHREGWAVLNADDPRVWAMRRKTRARLYAFSLEGRSDAVDAALDSGGRAATLEKGWIVLRAAGRRPRKLVEAAMLPVTFAGLSRYNIANALAAAAACDAIGLSSRSIRAGLRSFAQDSAANPGRLNLFERRGVFALVDFAHNEAGMTGLVDVARAVAGPGGGRVRLAFGTAGDRTDDILHSLGVIGGGADELVIAEKRHYLRGRDLGEMNEILRSGARAGGYEGEIEAYPTELDALQALLARSRRGDVCAVMAHVERGELFEWLESEQFRPVDVDRLRELIGS
jgi:cyanophycin synthetase